LDIQQPDLGAGERGRLGGVAGVEVRSVITGGADENVESDCSNSAGALSGGGSG
jgi:hypothetical protein